MFTNVSLVGLDRFLIGAFAFFFCMLLVFYAIRLFPKVGLIDRPHRYGLKREPIPYYGGLVLYVSFVISVLLFIPLTLNIIGLLVGATLMLFVSFLDDKYHISPFLRLFAQILAGIIVVSSGIGIHSLNNPFGGPFTLDSSIWTFTIMGRFFSISVLSASFTIFWVVLITNTVNFLDGLNGLTSGVVAIAAFFLFLLSIRDGHVIDQSVFSVMSLIIMSICIAFTLFDFYPSKIMMGDTGSVFLGFLLAVMAIFSGGKVATVFLIMGVPILDAFWVIGRRLLNRKSPFRGDLFHLHHRLKDTGLSERQAVLLVYFMTFVFGLLALVPHTTQKLIVAIFLIGFMVVLGAYLVFRKNRK